MHLSIRLLQMGHEVVGIDNINDYYDVRLKQARLKHITGDHVGGHDNSANQFLFHKLDLCDRAAMESLFDDVKPQIVINLAAQAGVRYSLDNPMAYIDANIIGFTHILELCRHHQIDQLIYASSSSVYGLNQTMPFSEADNVDHPLALYGATKKANELLAHSYSHLFGLPTTGLRFFTVYGPWGRPDMALFKFTKAILEGKPIDVYNHGEMARDFTYVTDLVDGIVRLIDAIPTRPNAASEIAEGDSLSPVAPHRIVNIGNSQSVPLMEFIAAIEARLGIEAQKNFMDMQAGDVPATWADASLLMRLTGYKPQTAVQDGVAAFVDWYRNYYRR